MHIAHMSNYRSNQPNTQWLKTLIKKSTVSVTANPKQQPGSFTVVSTSVANQLAKAVSKATPLSCTQPPHKHLT